jgi:HAD superfamily phosphoserine phosphatase-like hydrolase
LITDFDGAITEQDFYALVPNTAADWAEYTGGRITHFEAMRRIFARAPSDEGALDEMLTAMRPDPELSAAIARLAANGWDTVIVSAGSTWYIERILERAGVRLTVHANPGHIEPGRGLVLEMPPADSPFYSAEVGIDKSAVVRDALARYGRVAFAGDGPPDLPAALLVDAERRFARGWLARELTKRRQPFQSFRRWSEIAARLT